MAWKQDRRASEQRLHLIAGQFSGEAVCFLVLNGIPMMMPSEIRTEHACELEELRSSQPPLVADRDVAG